MRKLSGRVRKEYFDAIVAGKKRDELRAYTPYWIKRITGSDKGIPIGYRWRVDPGEMQFVFLCGKRIHRREIIAVSRIHTPLNFSAQGKLDVPTDTCFDLELGRESTSAQSNHISQRGRGKYE